MVISLKILKKVNINIYLFFKNKERKINKKKIKMIHVPFFKNIAKMQYYV